MDWRTSHEQFNPRSLADLSEATVEGRRAALRLGATLLAELQVARRSRGRFGDGPRAGRRPDGVSE
jgi:hypothetical protein